VNRLDLDDTADRLLGRCLRRQAEKIPDGDFIVWDREHIGYGLMNERANASALAFAGLGVAPGDTVSFFMETCPEWVWATLGLNKLGAIWVPTNVDYKGVWLQESFEDGDARILVADAALLEKVAALPHHPFEKILVRGDASGIDLGVPLLSIDELIARPGPEPDDGELRYGDTSTVMWTSGTTGRSKGVMQSHNVWIRAAVDGAQNIGLREGDVIYSCLPMYQSAAWVANIYRALVCGVPCAMDPRFSASEFWDRTASPAWCRCPRTSSRSSRRASAWRRSTRATARAR
jgi:crotonobetaine/carnitine-CoA ligase